MICDEHYVWVPNCARNRVIDRYTSLMWNVTIHDEH